MFKLGSFEEELFKGMEKKLMDSQLDKKYNFDKLSKAAECLTAAAELFNKADMKKEADAVIRLLNKVAVQLSSKVLL